MLLNGKAYFFFKKILLYKQSTMMKPTLLSLIFCLSMLFQSVNGQDLKNIWDQYEKASTDKATCQALIKKLENKKELNNVELAYLGALETIWAKYTSNPFSKWSAFKKGKEKIEEAVKREPDNPKIRYLRLSVQKNNPGFLGYNRAIASDEELLKGHLDNLTDKDLKDSIENLLKG